MAELCLVRSPDALVAGDSDAYGTLYDPFCVPVIDRHQMLGETAEAMRYSIEGGARGKIVVTMDHDNDDQA